MAVLHLMCGVPGAGKTTRARELARSLPAIRLAPDEWLYRVIGDGENVESRLAVEDVQWEIAARLLTLGIDVILENGFRTKAERNDFRLRARAIGASTLVHFMDAPIEELKRRLAIRNVRRPPDSFVVTEEQLTYFLGTLEPPGEDERYVL